MCLSVTVNCVVYGQHAPMIHTGIRSYVAEVVVKLQKFVSSKTGVNFCIGNSEFTVHTHLVCGYNSNVVFKEVKEF